MAKNFGVLLIVFLLVSCSEKPRVHIADLPKTTSSDSDVILFNEDFLGSTEPSHNVLPPHGRKEENRVTWAMDDNCITVADYKFCHRNDRIGTRLFLSFTHRGSEVTTKPLLYSSAALTDVDRPSDGWKEYSTSQLCP